MKKATALLLAAIMTVLLCACGAERAVPIEPWESEIYTDGEVLDAIEVVLDRFEGSKDLKLLQIKYDEACTQREIKYRSAHYGEETVIVLLADIYAELDSMAVGPFSPGRTCKDYQFVLTRNKLGRWTIADSGYA